MEAVSNDGGPSLALPIGKTELTRRHLIAARRRGFRPDLLNVHEDSLGLQGYLELAHAAGLLEDRLPEAHSPVPAMRRVWVVPDMGFVELVTGDHG
jgi:hypothetical protein